MHLKVSWVLIVLRKRGGLIKITPLQKKAKHNNNKVKHVRPDATHSEIKPQMEENDSTIK